MKTNIEQYNSRELFYFLSSIFLLFYMLQIPLLTSNADVLVYSCKSLSESPILKYAFLDQRSSLGKPILPNYHIAHTIILWAIYHISPDGLSNTIWPSGFVSAVSGGFIVGLTFLIWLELGLPKFTAFIVAVVVGFIPSIWYHNLIGEAYSLQLFSILLFLYLFLRNNIVLATVAFLFAALVSPISGLSFSLLLLAPRNKDSLIKAFTVGFFALLIYILIFYLIKGDILGAFLAVNPNRGDRSALWKIYKFSLIIILNINFFLFYLFKGCFVAWKRYKNHLNFLFIAITPQLIFIFLDRQYLTELGDFLLLILWALSFPIGLALTELKQKKTSVYLSFIGTVIISLTIWFLPNKQIATARNEAGYWLKQEIFEKMKIIGGWKNSIGISLARYGWDFEKLSNNYFDKDNPNTSDLLKTGEKSLIIVSHRWNHLRVQLSKLPISELEINKYDPSESIKNGLIQRIFENDAVIIYRWDKIPEDKMLEIQ